MFTKILHEPAFFQDMLHDFSVQVTQMFRDVSVFLMLRQKILPRLANWPFIKIWCAGCATGEEVYSLAIMLHEAGLLSRTTLYGTDYNDTVLKTGRDGIYSIKEIKVASQHYLAAGGTGSLSDYYRAKGETILIEKFLRDAIVWANHNLVTDGVFGDMQLILCRNVMIYFGPPLKDRVMSLFSSSLVRGGYLCLGNKESLDFTVSRVDYKLTSDNERIYRKISDTQNPQLLTLDKKTQHHQQTATGVVAIGGSMGGLIAIESILKMLPATFPLPILVTLHVSPDAKNLTASILQKHCSLIIKEAEVDEYMQPGMVYLAPPNYHLLLENNGCLSLSVDDRVSYARPSIDVMFESVAYACGKHAIGIVLSGANADGAKGLASIKAVGGYTMVQDPESAQSPTMPKAALSASAVNLVAPLNQLVAVLMEKVQNMPVIKEI